MKLKICGNTNPENISELLAIAPDYLGFIFYEPSKRYIGTDENIRRFIASIQISKKVGVFVNASLIDIRLHIKNYKLDLVQLHGRESPAFCKEIARTIPVIKTFGIEPGFDFALTDAYANACHYFLFDTAYKEFGGSGQTFDWPILQQYKGKTPFFLSGGISIDHLPAIKSFQHPSHFGIDVNSRFESAPGIKNSNSLKTFSHAIRNQ